MIFLLLKRQFSKLETICLHICNIIIINVPPYIITDIIQEIWAKYGTCIIHIQLFKTYINFIIEHRH